MGRFDKDFNIDYSVKRKTNGVYIMVVSGSLQLTEIRLSDRDAIGLWDTEKYQITANTQDAEILVMDVPMGFSAN